MRNYAGIGAKVGHSILASVHAWPTTRDQRTQPFQSLVLREWETGMYMAMSRQEMTSLQVQKLFAKIGELVDDEASALCERHRDLATIARILWFEGTLF